MQKFFIILLAVFSVSAGADNLKIVPGFQVCSIEYDGGTSGKVRYRKTGEKTWKNAHDPVFVESEKVLRTSLLKLEEDASYDVEVTSGNEKQISSFRTRKFDFPVAETVYLTGKDCGRTFKPKSGKPGAYIRYTAAPGFIFTSGKRAGIGILIENSEYIILDGLTVKGGVFNSVRIRNSKHIVITNCDISGFGQGGTFRPDIDGKYFNAKGKPIWHDAGISVRGCDDIVIERNYIHDPVTPGNSWFYSHPAGSDGIFIGDTKRAVIRYNDIVGSDKFRWNDAIAGDCNNFSLIGSCAEDAEICGNYFAFGNDDSVELDGGQKNARFFFNRIEGFYCGVSVAAVTRGPSFVYCNKITKPGDEFGLHGVALKTLCGKRIKWGIAFFYRNQAEGKPMGYPRIAGSYTFPRFICRENRYPAADGGGMYEPFKEKNYTVDINDKLIAPEDVPEYPAKHPVRPSGMAQDNETVIFSQPGNMASRTVTIKYNGKNPAGYKVEVCRATDHFKVTPKNGVIKPGGSVTLTVTPVKRTTAKLHSGALLFRLEDGRSLPVSIYVDARKDKSLAEYAVKNMIKGSISKKGSAHTMMFDVPADGNYILFVRKGDDCANRLDLRLPGKEPVLRIMKLRSRHHKWDVPAGDKSNVPLVLKKGRCEITIQKSRGSSKEPDITRAYLCPDWHNVLPVVDQLDDLLEK